MREILLRTWRPTSLDSTGNLHRNFRCNRNIRFCSEPEYPVPNGQKMVRIGKGYKYPFFVHQPFKLSLSLSSIVRKASSTRISLNIHPNLLIFGDLKEKT